MYFVHINSLGNFPLGPYVCSTHYFSLFLNNLLSSDIKTCTHAWTYTHVCTLPYAQALSHTKTHTYTYLFTHFHSRFFKKSYVTFFMMTIWFYNPIYVSFMDKSLSCIKITCFMVSKLHFYVSKNGSTEEAKLPKKGKLIYHFKIMSAGQNKENLKKFSENIYYFYILFTLIINT